MSQNLINISEKHVYVTCRSLSAEEFTLQVRWQKGSYLYEYLVSLCRNWEASLNYEYSKFSAQARSSSFLAAQISNFHFLSAAKLLWFWWFKAPRGADSLSVHKVALQKPLDILAQHWDWTQTEVLCSDRSSRAGTSSSFQCLGALLCHHLPSASTVALAFNCSLGSEG